MDIFTFNSLFFVNYPSFLTIPLQFHHSTNTPLKEAQIRYVCVKENLTSIPIHGGEYNVRQTLRFLYCHRRIRQLLLGRGQAVRLPDRSDPADESVGKGSGLPAL